MNDLATITNSLTGKSMTSREIAEVTGKRHDHVLRDIDNLIAQGAIGAPNFGETSFVDGSNRKQREYLLDFDATMTLVTGYNANLRAAVIRRWRELETGEALPAVQVKGPKRWGRTAMTTSQLASEFLAFKRVALAVGLTGNAAVISANGMTEREYGIAPLGLLGIELKSEDNERVLLPSESSRILGWKNAHEVNLKLAELGLQERLPGKKGGWRMTDKGAEYGVLIDTTKRHNNGAMVQQIKWKESVLLLLTEGFQA